MKNRNIFKTILLYALMLSLVLPSFTDIAYANDTPTPDKNVSSARAAGEAWKPDHFEDGSDAMTMSRTGYAPTGPTNFRGKVKDIHYTEYKNATDGFGWSRKPEEPLCFKWI